MSLTFFVELEAAELCSVVDQDWVLEALHGCGAGLSVALLDLSAERARALRRLSDAEIPLTAWLVLPQQEGYWLTADNWEVAQQRYHGVRRWAVDNDVCFQCVGLDIEPPRLDAEHLVSGGLSALWDLFKRRRSPAALQRARGEYAALVAAIRADGYKVESYQFPLIVDERAASSSLLQRTMGLVDLLPDREVLMLYESLLPPRFAGHFVLAYGEQADGIALGSTGGGVDFMDRRRLAYDELCSGLSLAAQFTDELYIFSLEGCLAQGYLEPLCHTVGDRVLVPIQSPLPASRLRRLLGRVLSAAGWLERRSLL